MSTPSDVVSEIAGRGLRNIRLSFADQHGLLRGKVLAADHIADAFDSGVGITGSLLTKDTGHQYAFDLWQGTGGPTLASIAGARDIVMVPDASTFRVLPWADGTGWMQCDLFTVDRQPIELSTRRVCQLAEQRLLDAGFRLRAGLEIEFHLYQRDPSASDPGRPTPVHPGWDLLSDRHSDLIDPVLEPIQRDLDALGLAPRSIEAELGPGQIELTFAPAMGTTVADQAVLVRSAIKQIAHRHGLHATFMSRPGFPDAFPSGWHLHQSLTGPDGAVNIFAPDPESGQGIGIPN